MKNPLTLEAFADWAEKQPADKRYDYLDCDECACAQYAKTMNIVWRDHHNGAMPGFWYDADSIACEGSWNFGALAQRLRGDDPLGPT